MTTPPDAPETTKKTLQRKRIIYVRPFNGEIQPGDLQLITDELNTELAENGAEEALFFLDACD